MARNDGIDRTVARNQDLETPGDGIPETKPEFSEVKDCFSPIQPEKSRRHKKSIEKICFFM